MTANITTVVVDEGSSQVKAVWMEGGELKQLIVKSRGDYRRLETADGGYSDHVYTTEGRDISIYDTIDNPISTNSDFYQTSDINRVLTHHALRIAGFGGKRVDLIVTLPVDTFYQDANKRHAKKTHMMEPVTNINNLAMPVIEQVRVAPEALPVLDSLCLDDTGQLKDEFNDVDRVMVVDIGGTTTDITIVRGDNSLEKRISVKMGVFNIADNLRQAIFDDTSITASAPSIHALDIALRTNKFRQKHDVSDYVKHACQPIISRLLGEMTRLQEDADELDFITYVGGGAYLLSSPLSRQYGGNTIQHPDPEFAVSNGLMKNHLAQLIPA